MTWMKHYFHRTIEYPTLSTKLHHFQATFQSTSASSTWLHVTVILRYVIVILLYVTNITCNSVIINKLLELLMHTVLECKIYRWCLQCKSTNTDIHTNDNNRSYRQLGWHVSYKPFITVKTMYKVVHKIAGSWTWNIHVNWIRL